MLGTIRLVTTCLLAVGVTQLPLVQHAALMKLYDWMGCNTANACPRFPSNATCPPASAYPTAFLVCKAEGVTQITIFGGRLSGTLPCEIGLLSALTRFEVNGQQLSGTLPTQIGLLSRLTAFSVSGQTFSGTIPTEIGSLAALQRLRLDNSQFSGSLPTELDALVGLVEFRVDHNRLRGYVSSSLGIVNACTLQANDSTETNCFSHCPSTCCVNRTTCTSLPPTPPTTSAATTTLSPTPSPSSSPSSPSAASSSNSLAPAELTTSAPKATNSDALIGGIIAAVLLGVLFVIGSIYVAFRWRRSHKNKEQVPAQPVGVSESAAHSAPIAPLTSPRGQYDSLSASSRHYDTTVTVLPSKATYDQLRASEIVPRST